MQDDATDRILAAAAAAAPTSLQPVIEAAAARLKKPQTPQTDNEWTSGDSSGYTSARPPFPSPLPGPIIQGPPSSHLMGAPGAQINHGGDLEHWNL